MNFLLQVGLETWLSGFKSNTFNKKQEKSLSVITKCVVEQITLF